MANGTIHEWVERVKAILISPDTEWPIIADERATIAELYQRYVAVLAAIPALFGFIKVSLIGFDVPLIGTMWVGVGAGLAGMVVGYLLALAQVYTIAMIVDTLAPTFGAQRNLSQAFKLTAYAFTAAWVAGLGQIVPLIGVLIPLVGGVYSIYLFHIGLPVMMKCPREQASSYTLVSIVAAIVLSLVFSYVVHSVTGEKGSGEITRTDIEFNEGGPMHSLDGRTRKNDDAMKQAAPAQ